MTKAIWTPYQTQMMKLKDRYERALWCSIKLKWQQVSVVVVYIIFVLFFTIYLFVMLIIVHIFTPKKLKIIKIFQHEYYILFVFISISRYYRNIIIRTNQYHVILYDNGLWFKVIFNVDLCNKTIFPPSSILTFMWVKFIHIYTVYTYLYTSFVIRFLVQTYLNNIIQLLCCYNKNRISVF